MFRLLMERKNRKPQVYQLKKATTLIGRGKDTDLLLPDISVSRHHAEIRRTVDDIFTLVDLGSQNGTLVNKQAVKEHTLVSGDQIQVGKFLMMFEKQPIRHVEDGPAVNPVSAYNVDDERTGYLRKISAIEGEEVHSTTHLTAEQLDDLRRQVHIAENGRIEVVNQPQDSWLIGKETLNFGKGGVPASGMGIGGSARIEWNGKVHTIMKHSGVFLSVKLNGIEVKKPTPLTNGDLLVVGKTAFRYRV